MGDVPARTETDLEDLALELGSGPCPQAGELPATEQHVDRARKNLVLVESDAPV
jgi:hypothetical protein